MATDQRSLPAFFNTDADFQAWCQGIAAQLVVAGLVKTADTGQINNATVVKPAATNTVQGYEIYRFNDALQATVPVFIKIEYGSGGAVDRPSLWWTVGSSTNGAGTLGGQLSARRQFNAISSKSAGVTLPSYCCGNSTGAFMMVNNYDSASTNFGLLMIIERTRDGSGAATSDGVIMFGSAISNNNWHQILPASGSVPAGLQNTSVVCVASVSAMCTNNTIAVAVYGTSVAVAPYMTFIGKALFGMAACYARSSDVSPGVSMVVNNLGANHTYLPLTITGAYTPTGSSGDIPLLLWE